MSEKQLDDALQSLERPAASSWRDVRRVARGHRVRRGAAVGVVALAAAAAIVVPQLGGGGLPPIPGPSLQVDAGVTTGDRVGAAVQLVAKTAPLTAADPDAESSVAQAEQSFAAHLLQQVGSSTGNVSVSPASLALALAMLQNGARGTTQQQISSALGTSVDAANAGWSAQSADWSDAAKSAGIDYSSANSLWQQRGLKLDAPFVTALTRYFASGVWQVDFAHHMPDALSAINAWTAQHTNNKIPKLFDELDPSTVLVLANAVYFHATWQSQFVASVSEPAPFHTAGGAVTTPTFMTSPRDVRVAQTNDYDAAQLPYTGGRFAAQVVMPTHGSLRDFVGGLDGSALSDISSAMTGQSVVKLPRFTTTSNIGLMPVLAKLGITQALSPTADFSAISPTPTYVGQAIQRVYLKVAEKGTEAAAATGIAMVPTASSAVPETLDFDHPFLFLIRDTHTGAVLFASEINDPS